MKNQATAAEGGFTLIELSIVLVIIGLIVGGILVGQNLIESAQIRALISQIEKYKTAVNTFRGKYNGELPGDMLPSDAATFGLWSGCTWSQCATNAGNPAAHTVANNDGIIYMGVNQGQTIGQACGGECSMFWRHLSDAKMVDGGFGADLNTAGDPQTMDSNGFYVDSLYAPAAKSGSSYVAIASLYYSPTYGFESNNLRAATENAFYFITQDKGSVNGNGSQAFTPTLTPSQASNIDRKIDDGNPTLGSFLMEGLTGPTNSFSSAATSGYCVYGVSNVYNPSTYSAGQGQYNTSPSTGGNMVSCVPLFVIK